VALWQYKPRIVPAGVSRDRLVPDELCWVARQPPMGFEQSFGAFAPEAASWSPSLRIWGDERGDAIFVSYSEDDGSVEEIEARLDARAPNLARMERLCSIAQCLSAVFVHRGRVLEPTLPSLRSAMETSLAARFVKNPAQTLRELPDPDLSNQFVQTDAMCLLEVDHASLTSRRAGVRLEALCEGRCGLRRASSRAPVSEPR
jgi:hypothetical protein